MPELPEVEFARRSLEKWLVGEKLARVEADKSRILRGSTPAALEKLAGHVVLGVERRGKQLLVRLDGGAGLLGHLGMTGKFELQRPGGPEVRWSRARLGRGDGAVVHYRDPRMLGLLRPGALAELEASASWADLGPDAWETKLTGALLKERLGKRKKSIKEALLDQTALAGIGNIQATEALWKAKLAPAQRADRLSTNDFAALAKAIRWSLERTLGAESGETITYVEENPAENPFTIYGRAGEKCPRCKTVLKKKTIGGRTTAFCPKCQQA